MRNPNTFRFIRLFLYMIICLLPAMPSAYAQATSPVVVRVAPVSVEVPVGQTVEVAVELLDVQELYGADVSLTFDPRMVEVVDADPDQSGAQVASGPFLDPGFVVLNQVDNVTGTLRFAMTQLNPSQPKSGTGALINFRLRGKQVGMGMSITLIDAALARRDGSSMPTRLVSGQLSVVAPASSGPGDTPTPTEEISTPLPTSTQTLTPVQPAATSTPTSLRPTLTSRSTAAPTVQASIAPPTLTATATSLSPTTTPRPTTMTSAAQMPIGTSLPDSRPQPATSGSALASPAADRVDPLTGRVAVAATAQPSPIHWAAKLAVTPTAVAAFVQGAPRSSTVLFAVAGLLGVAGVLVVMLVIRQRST